MPSSIALTATAGLILPFPNSSMLAYQINAGALLIANAETGSNVMQITDPAEIEAAKREIASWGRPA